MDQKVKDIIESVRLMVAAGILIPEYEVCNDSYVCFVTDMLNGKGAYYTGKLDTFSEDIRWALNGAYLNETRDGYKVIGIYQIRPGYE